MLFRQLFDSESSTYSYLIGDRQTRTALLIDPVRDQIERDLRLLGELGLTLRYVLDTHTHADHVTAAGMLRARTGAITVAAAPCADLRLTDGDSVAIGALRLRALATPGHTDDSVSYQLHDRVFTGDALLIRAAGRTDLQNGDAAQLYDSITTKLFVLPDETLVYPAHDYQGRTVTTIGEERQFNLRIAGRTRAEFVAVMAALDLPLPDKLALSVPTNRACGMDDVLSPRVYRDVAPSELGLHAPGARIVDVRERDEFHGPLGRIPLAELVPLAELMERSRRWDKQTTTILVCRSGRRSAAGAAHLAQRGFTRVLNLAGGMQAYRAESLPTEFGPCLR